MNYDHRAYCELITGKKGSGKSTYFLALAKRHRARFKFVFDPVREAARKLGWPVCIDERRMLAALAAGRPVCFDSTALFPGDRREGFAFFTRWVMEVCKEIRGVKLLACDELQSCQMPGPGGMPKGFKEITDEGRRQEIDCLFAAQRLNEINDDVRGQLTAITTFRHDDPLALRWLSDRGFDPMAVAALPAPGGWIRKDDDGKITTGGGKRLRPAHASRAAGC